MNKMKTYFLLKGYTTNDDHEEDEYKEKEKHMSMKEIASGPHWSLAETKEVAEKHKMTKYDEYAWYVTMNMMYSDYYKVIEKMNADPVSFACYMSDAFLGDTDSVPANKKVKEYFEHIVQH